MLTSMYYYNHYRPYIVKSVDSAGERKGSLAKNKITENNESSAEIALNKSLSTDVVKYAKGIYRNTTDLKYASKRLSSDIRNYTKYKGRNEFNHEAFRDGFQDDLEHFTESYSKSVNFLKNQNHSLYLGAAAEKLENIVAHSSGILSTLGIKGKIDQKDILGLGSDKGESPLFAEGLEVDKTASTLFDRDDIDNKLAEASKFFTDIYQEANGLLSAPMSKHMNFKNLNYYYNYNVEKKKVQVDSFQIIKTGLLVNIAL